MNREEPPAGSFRQSSPLMTEDQGARQCDQHAVDHDAQPEDAEIPGDSQQDRV
jgi:hypothetical protein